jgi:hypothetical protein
MATIFVTFLHNFLGVPTLIEERDSMFLQNTGIHTQNYVVSQHMAIFLIIIDMTIAKFIWQKIFYIFLCCSNGMLGFPQV